MARHWLLLLGSNQPDDGTLRAAQERLGSLGAVQALTPIEHLRPASGKGPWYFNTLIALHSELPRDGLRESLRRIEIELGRDRREPDIVAIDIDLLGWQQHDLWHADAHALAKGEPTRWPTTHLLKLAGLSLAGGDAALPL